MSKNNGCLFIVSTPIGNQRDITLRAKDVLSDVDAVICEERRQGSTLLKKLGLQEKELILLNEHNEKESSPIIAEELSLGKRYALISDCGTPAFADPGTELIKICYEKTIKVIPIPGPSSLITAISLSPMPMEEFYFAGFLPKKKEIRYQKLNSFRKMKVPIILMDAPYRLSRLLSEVSDSFGKSCLVTMAFDLTLPTEMIVHGAIEEIQKRINDKKGEFILILYP
ncbi:MAG: 16S rRNA (cytidine(1402)-2'-O)-methyltransferase [Pelolinea sp.]|nr:16S rRNA (cytidine(1402)-2'-O)-methyltransferase [Pelolinea sp.]